MVLNCWGFFIFGCNSKPMNQFFFCILLFFNFAAFAQSEADCLKFHTGTFKFPDPRFQTIEVKRSENWQSETDTAKDSEIAGNIEWISPCQYMLTFKTQKKANAEQLIGKKITTEIIEVKGNECKIRIILDGAPPIETTMIKVE